MKWQQQQAAREQMVQMLRVMDAFSEGVMLCDPTRPLWPILFVNDAWVAATGVSREAALEAAGFWELFTACPGSGSAQMLGELQQGQEEGQGQEEQGQRQQQGKQQGTGGNGAVDARAAEAVAQRKTFTECVELRGGSSTLGSCGGSVLSVRSGSAGSRLLIEFKPSGGGDHLREDIPHIGIPAYVAVSGGQQQNGSSGSSIGGQEDAQAPAPGSPPQTAARPVEQFYFGIIHPARREAGRLHTPFASADVPFAPQTFTDTSTAGTPIHGTPSRLSSSAAAAILGTRLSTVSCLTLSGGDSSVTSTLGTRMRSGMLRTPGRSQTPSFKQLRPKVGAGPAGLGLNNFPSKNLHRARV